MSLKRCVAVLGVLAMLLPGCSGDEASRVTLVVNGIAGESGSVWESGEVYLDVAAVGDSSVTDKGIRGFVSFDISGIPADADLETAVLDLSGYLIRPGELDPFLAPNPLGSFQVLAQNYGALDAADYDGATYATMYNAAAGGAALSGIDALAGLRGALSGGYSRFQVRLQFATESNGDGLAQLARFDDVGAKLAVEYR